MKAADVFHQNDGGVTQRYYAELKSRGPRGEIALCLFRCQKRSSRAKDYKRGRYRSAAYDVKSWSMGELCRLLGQYADEYGFTYGWKPDPSVPFGDRPSHVLYVDIPGHGQWSAHSPDRGAGPDYPGDWDHQHASESRALAFADAIMGSPAEPASTPPQADDVQPLEESLIPTKLVFGDPASIARARSVRRSRH